MMLVPSMVQIAGAPLSCCERISELPSPLKSAASAICQVGPGLGRAAPRLRLVPSMIPTAARLVEPANSMTVPVPEHRLHRRRSSPDGNWSRMIAAPLLAPENRRCRGM